jgi:hypothetical protein
MTLAWIDQRLYLAPPGHVSCLRYRKEENETVGRDEQSENMWF